MTGAKVPFLDLHAAYAELKDPIDSAVARVLGSGWYIGGPELERFEHEFAGYCGAAHCIGVANGLDALTLALMAMDVGAGDEVIVPAHTFVATWLAVSRTGAMPVAVDIDSGHYGIDAAALEAAITPRTRAIIPVHLYGHPCDLGAVLAVAARHELKVIEDAAQAHGARYRGARIGSHSDAVAWSFYPGKNLGALGDGGAVTCNDVGLAERIRRLGNYGSSQKYRHEELGLNSRLDPVQAAVLSVKLAHLDEWNARRSAVADRYRDALCSLPGLLLPQVAQWAEPAWHLFVIQVERREVFMHFLAERGIQSLMHYPLTANRQPAYSEVHGALAMPVSYQAADRVVSLPMGPHLGDQHASLVIDTIRDYFKT